MAITIHINDGMFLPVIRCEICGVGVTTDSGNACWAMPEAGSKVEVHYVHKRCQHIYDKMYPDIYWLTANMDQHIIALFLSVVCMDDRSKSVEGLTEIFVEMVHHILVTSIGD